jgi:hypothetical protein
MKKIIIIIIGLALVVGGSVWWLIDRKVIDFGGAISNSKVSVMLGSSTNLIKTPQVYVFAGTTTTDELNDGGLINQYINTKGAHALRLNFQAVGNYATSTLHIRPQVSIDGVTYYDLIHATSTTSISATTTVDVIASVESIVIGTATTSGSILFNIPATDHARFILMGDNDADYDRKEGVQAWIEVSKEEQY